MVSKTWGGALVLSLILAVLIGSGTASAETPRIGQVDHSIYSQLLAETVKEGVVDYGQLANNRNLERYLEQLADADPDALSSDAEKLAFYINAYNAFAIKGILKGYSPASFLGRFRYFRLANYRLGGEEITLHDLEHGIIRKLGEPRIHFALVCAARSCPKLRAEAYLPETLNRQLHDNTVDFINDPGKNRFDKENKVAYLSSIFDWFAEDFTRSGDTVQQFVAGYVKDPGIAAELAANQYRVAYLDYDWTLNGSN